MTGRHYLPGIDSNIGEVARRTGQMGQPVPQLYDHGRRHPDDSAGGPDHFPVAIAGKKINLLAGVDAQR